MNDKPASPQIVDLFEAIKSTLLTAKQHPPSARERSVGDVPAQRFSTDPEMDAALEADEAKLIAMGAYDQHPYAKSARDAERAAVVKFLRVCGFGSGSVHWRLADDIEAGEHLK